MLAYTSEGWQLHPSEDLERRYYTQGDISPESSEFAAAAREFRKLVARGVRAYNAAERCRLAWKDAAPLINPAPIDPAGVVIPEERLRERRTA
jgi:hypothetical protein